MSGNIRSGCMDVLHRRASVLLLLKDLLSIVSLEQSRFLRFVLSSCGMLNVQYLNAISNFFLASCIF
jgi:hypothetical protein